MSKTIGHNVQQVYLNTAKEQRERRTITLLIWPIQLQLLVLKQGLQIQDQRMLLILMEIL